MTQMTQMMSFIGSIGLGLISLTVAVPTVLATPRVDRQETCELLIIGGGLAGSAAAYEALLAGRTVCMTEITDWVGGQISSQGTSALDERNTQQSRLFFPSGYLELREQIEAFYGRLNPGGCWVSASCFLPVDGHQILFQMLQDAAKQGNGRLKWFPSTVVKEVKTANRQITKVIAIQHQPATDTPPLNTEPLSGVIEDAYGYEDSSRFLKTIIEFVPSQSEGKTASWYVIEATETGEMIGLTDIPYQLGVDRRSADDPTASSITGEPYCTQGFTYTFAMEATESPQTHILPDFYPQYAPYYSYELERLADFNLVYTYRRIHIMKPDEPRTGNFRQWPIYPGDISMQNWTWGNDYRPGNPEDNFILTRDQLQATGQLQPGGWMGGLRTETLRRGEEHAMGFFYWLVAGITDSQLGDGVKQPHPNHRYLKGLDSPMGTEHGLSKYPYIREGRRIIGRPAWGYPEGFMVAEIDISRNDFRQTFYRENLSPSDYHTLWTRLAGLELPALLTQEKTIAEIKERSRATIYQDSVGIGHYALDFHPCMTETPPEAPGNTERAGERLAQGAAYPFQIPLRAMIPQQLDNLLIVGKSIATSHIAAAAYRVHSFEWSSGVAAAITADFALKQDLFPYELVDELPRREPQLEALQQRIQQQGNPIAFPETSIFNNSWEDWE